MHTYVNFAGTCAEAFRYDEKHLGGKIGMMMMHGQTPDQSKVRPEMKDAVLHARISVAEPNSMGADIPSAQPMRSAYLVVGCRPRRRGRAHLSALSEGGEVLHADAGDVFRQQIRPAARSVWHQLDDHA